MDDVQERFGWDEEECLVFDRTKPSGESTFEKGPLYEEVTKFELIEIANDLAAEVRALRKDRERAKSEIEKAVELIQRWDCECEPQIGFTCGPCRVVEIIDAAMASRGEDA